MSKQVEKPTQQQLSQEALARKQANEAAPDYLRHQQDTAAEGSIAQPNPDAPVDGAFEQEGHRPVLERSRKVR